MEGKGITTTDGTIHNLHQTSYFRPKFRPLGIGRPFCALMSVGLIARGCPTAPADTPPPSAVRSSPFACPPIPAIPPPIPKLACCRCALLRGLSGLSARGGKEPTDDDVGLPTPIPIPMPSLVVLRRAAGRFSWYPSSNGPAEPSPIRRVFSCLACTARKWLKSSCHLISSRATLEREEAIVETGGLFLEDVY